MWQERKKRETESRVLDQQGLVPSMVRKCPGDERWGQKWTGKVCPGSAPQRECNFDFERGRASLTFTSRSSWVLCACLLSPR